MRAFLSFVTACFVALFASASFADGNGPRSKGPSGQAQVDLIFPPLGYVLDPSDALPPIYIFKDGPAYYGPNVIALPTYSEGGHSYLVPYPNIGQGYVEPYRSPYRGFYRPRWRSTQVYRTWGPYAYRPAASARVIVIPPDNRR